MTSEPLLSEIEEQAELPVEDHSARNRLVIGLLLVSAFVVILNETIMGVAIPHLMNDLKIPASSAQWLTSAFMLTMAVVIPVTGFLLQRLNTRPVFILAMSLFSAGTLVSALAPGFPFLVVGRIVQASGTAIMMPLLMTTIMNLVPPHSRGRTMGNISIVISVAPAIGPTISGLILSTLDWRWLFLLVLPIALAALALGAAKIENVTVPSKAPLDVVSVVLSAIGFGSFVFGVSELGAPPEAGATPFDPRVTLLAGAAVIAIFVWRQIHLQKRERALLDLRTLQTKTFTIAAGMMAILMMSMFGVFILLPIYLLSVLGQTTLTTGLLLLPGGLIMGLCAPFVGGLFDRYGPARLVIPGAVLFSGVMWSLTFISTTTPVWMVLAIHIVLSIGLALMFTPLFTVSLGSLPPKLYSHGSAIIGTTQQVAGAAGTTLYVAIMTWRAGILTQGKADAATATVGGMQSAFFVGALISLAAVVASFYVRRPPSQPEGQPLGH